jgi:FAD/FMN-containing dehydrogenase
MLPPPPVRGIYRTDSRARAAYAEGAGIYRILPQAVCVPADIDDLQQLIRWASQRLFDSTRCR